MRNDFPAPQGLYDPQFEHDSCGVSFVVDMQGRRSHSIVDLGLRALCNLEHRGASGAEVNTGDGAGILVQMPDAFLRGVIADDGLPFALPPLGQYAAGLCFLPRDQAAADAVARQVERVVMGEGLRVLVGMRFRW